MLYPLSMTLFRRVLGSSLNFDTASTVPIYRFFNTVTGGHFFTASELEKEAIANIPQLRFEGETFLRFPNLYWRTVCPLHYLC